MRRRTSGHTLHPIPMALLDTYGGNAGYTEAMKIFDETVDKWFGAKRVNKKTQGGRIYFDTDHFLVIEEIPFNLNVRVVTLKGCKIKIKLELVLNRDIPQERLVVIKHGDIEALRPIVESKYFSLGTHKRTIKTYIRDTLLDIQKRQPRI